VSASAIAVRVTRLLPSTGRPGSLHESENQRENDPDRNAASVVDVSDVHPFVVDVSDDGVSDDVVSDDVVSDVDSSDADASDVDVLRIDGFDADAFNVDPSGVERCD